MPIEHVLAVVPVSDLERADAWYEALFGRPADNRPMPSLVEWQVTAAGWVQVTVDTDRAGSGLLNFAVDDLEATRAELATRGVDTGEIEPVSKRVELSATTDPDGNRDHADRQLPCEVLAKGGPGPRSRRARADP
jgi:glyoxylase I family protein